MTTLDQILIDLKKRGVKINKDGVRGYGGTETFWINLRSIEVIDVAEDKRGIAFERIKELMLKWNDNEIDNVTALVDILAIVSKVEGE
jgi:hypothetical protein